MKKAKATKLVATTIIALIATIALVSCSQGVPVEDAREMQGEIQSISNRVSQVESTLLELKSEGAEATSEEMQEVFDDLINELREVSTRMAEIEAKLDFPEPEAMDAGMPGEPAPAAGY